MYMEIRNIGKIRHLIPTHIAEMLVSSLVLSKLDYCNALLVNSSKENKKRLQVAQNNAARLVLKKKKREHATPMLYALHWLPVEKRIVYKICSLVYKCLNTDCPEYLKELIDIYVPSRSLRSSEIKDTLKSPTIPRKIGEQSFFFSAPHFWNSLPGHVRTSESISIFKSRLKFYLFPSLDK